MHLADKHRGRKQGLQGVLQAPRGGLVRAGDRIATDEEPEEAPKTLRQRIMAAEKGADLEVRPPVVVVLGHVDHGRRAIAAGVMLALGSDAHHAEGLEVMRYGVVTARRGWAEPANIANSLGVDDLLARLKAGKA